MFLKSMEIFGFKSFADKTYVKFEPGITILVGPNGCGKSNIVDAIKWVLGEKNVRNIRGERLEDIIFSGTDQRAPLSLAEVSIDIDNTSNILDFDSDIVTVGRRVFRDGESEYLINKSSVRLKDIEKLFMDTGIGKSAYSVMEQGKMDLILSNRAEDRRYIFEEAAGISRYKLQKKESLKKLEETKQNLDRINDIIKEIDREKNIKAKQAEKTNEYLKLRKEYAMVDTNLNVLKQLKVISKKEKLEDEIERDKQKRESISAKVSAVLADNEKDEKQKNDLQHQLFELEKNLHTYKIRIEDIESKIEKNKGFIKENENRLERADQKREERSKNLARLLEEQKEAKSKQDEILKEIDLLADEVQNLSEQRKNKITGIKNSRLKIKENKNEIISKKQKVEISQNDLESVIKRLLNAIAQRKEELKDFEQERQGIRSQIYSKIKIIEEKIKEIRKFLHDQNLTDALSSLDQLDLNSFENDIKKFESYEDGFRSILFDEGGIHAEKENLDYQIKSELKSIDDLNEANISLDDFIQKEQAEVEQLGEQATELEKKLSKSKSDTAWITKQLESLEQQADDVQQQIKNYQEDGERYQEAIKKMNREIEEWGLASVKFSEESTALISKISEYTSKRSEIEQKISDRRSISKKDEESLKEIANKIVNLEKSLVELNFKENSLKEYLWTEYEKDISDFDNFNFENEEEGSLNNKLKEFKRDIQNLGPINNLAIKEFEDLKERSNYYQDQRNDILKAREDIIGVISDIDATSIEMFTETFAQIAKNFSDIFKELFEGGEAVVSLADPEHVLESGVDIKVRPPGKKAKSINLLSGGEKALTAIALLFATYRVKPSPFCFLDEIDAPLDEENIGRFVRMLKNFSKGSQFILVTHNKKTMSIGEAIYGITMQEPGISSLISLKMEKYKNEA